VSVDYFASAVYGFEVPDDLQHKLNDFEVRLALEGFQPDGDPGEWTDELRKQLQTLRNEAGRALKLSPRHTAMLDLHYTGSEDDRPGRCRTEAEIWLLGLGLLQLPLNYSVPPLHKYGPALIQRMIKLKAGWHTWVSAG
jgi:hypothetical protein